jgi:hypothetical protein
MRIYALYYFDNAVKFYRDYDRAVNLCNYINIRYYGGSNIYRIEFEFVK